MGKTTELKEKIGIDKSVIYLDLLQINWTDLVKAQGKEKAHKDDKISINWDVKNVYPEAYKDKSLKSISLYDDEIGQLYINARFDKVRCAYKYVSRLELKSCTDGNNLNNLSVKEYKYRVQMALQTLYFRYGLLFDGKTVLVNSLEVNATIELIEKYQKYNDAIEFIIKNMPCRYYSEKENGNIKYACWHEVNIKNNTDSVQTVVVKNANIQFKIYNKGKHLSDKGIWGDCKQSFLRAEYTFNARTLKRYFDGNLSLKALTDSKIQYIYKHFFGRDIVRPYEDWRNNNTKELKSLVIAHQNYSRYWVDSFLRDCREYNNTHALPVLFDIEDMRAVFKSLDCQNYRKKYLSFENKCVYEHDLKGNTGRLTEIIDKIYRLTVTSEVTHICSSKVS